MVGHAKIRLDEWIVKFVKTMYANTKCKFRVNNLYTGGESWCPRALLLCFKSAAFYHCA